VSTFGLLKSNLLIDNNKFKIDNIKTIIEKCFFGQMEYYLSKACNHSILFPICSLVSLCWSSSSICAR
jgi:hypothetical protein